MQYVFYAILIGAAAAVALYVVKKLRTDKEPEHMAVVRRYVEGGNFEKAGDVHRTHGNLREAMNLYVRAEAFSKASVVAEEVKDLRRAALFAEKATEYLRAGELFEQISDFQSATKTYQRSGNFARAAGSLERDPGAALSDIAAMWENACLTLIPDDAASDTLEPDVVERIRELALKAGEAHRTAGNLVRAAKFFEQAGVDSEGRRIASADKADKLATILSSKTDVEVRHDDDDDDATGVMKVRPRAPVPASSPASAPAPASASAPQPIIQNVTYVVQGSPTGGGTEGLPMPPGMAHAPTLASPTSPGSGVPVSSLGPAVHREMIYIRDGMTNATTPVARDAGRYTIGEMIGEGGMAVVHKAFDTTLEREVALKFMPEGFTDNPMLLRFFEREAKAAAGLNHPNIITVHDFGLLEGRPFICMELVEGKTIDAVLEDIAPEKMPLDGILEVANGLFAALEFAHRKDVVHRDVKPSNIMATVEGHIKLMDFGIARGIDRDQSTLIVGTPSYMAPEQFEGKGIDHRTDLFAAGVTLYEICTGELPFEGMGRASMPSHRPRQLRPELPIALDAFIWRCLQLSPDDRFPTTSVARGGVAEIARQARTAVRSVADVMTSPDPVEEDESEIVDLQEMVEDLEARRQTAPAKLKSEPAPVSAEDLDFDFGGLPEALSQDATLGAGSDVLAGLGMLDFDSPEETDRAAKPDVPAFVAEPLDLPPQSPDDNELLNELELLFAKHHVESKPSPSPESPPDAAEALLYTVRNLKELVQSGEIATRGGSSSGMSADVVSDINQLLLDYTSKYPEQTGKSAGPRGASAKRRRPEAVKGIEGLEGIESLLSGYLKE